MIFQYRSIIFQQNAESRIKLTKREDRCIEEEFGTVSDHSLFSLLTRSRLDLNHLIGYFNIEALSLSRTLRVR